MHFALEQGDGRRDDMIGMAGWRIVKCTIYGDDKRNDTHWFPTAYLNTTTSFLIRCSICPACFLRMSLPLIDWVLVAVSTRPGRYIWFQN